MTSVWCFVTRETLAVVPSPFFENSHLGVSNHKRLIEAPKFWEGGGLFYLQKKKQKMFSTLD